MAEMTWQYIAGFFDGEGSICVCSQVRTHYKQGGISWQCTIVQSQREILAEISGFLEKRGIPSAVRANKFYPQSIVKSRKQMYALVIKGGRTGIFGFLLGCFPYLRVKKVVAQDAMRTMTLNPPLRGLTRIPKKWSADDRLKFSDIKTAYWSNEEKRLAASMRSVEWWSLPQNRQGRSERMTKWWADRKANI